MKKPVFQPRYVIWFFSAAFIFFAIEFFFGFNFNPDYLMLNHLLDVSRRHYQVVLPGHLFQQSLKVNFHVISGLALVILGLFQINDQFRIKNRQLHRWLGWIYMAVGFAAATFGLLLSQKALGGRSTQIAFIIIALLWYLSAYKSVAFALKGSFKQHRRWTLRNYIATLATGFIRPLIVLTDLIFPNQSPELLFQFGVWGCLLAGLALSQWLVVRNNGQAKI